MRLLRLPRLPRLLSRCAACAVLLALCALQALALLRSPAAWLPARIDVQLAPGAAIELDGAALAVPAADARLRLRRDAEGRWWAANAGAGTLRLERGGRSVRSASQVLRPGMRFRLGALTYTVEAAGTQSLRLNDGRHLWRYDGATVRRDGAPLAACPGDGPGARLAGAWNRWLPSGAAIERPLVFGGALDCGTRVGNAHAAPGSALLRFADGAPLLSAASAGASQTPLLVERGGLPFELALAEQPLAGVSALGIGRTRIEIDAAGGVLRLRPASRVALAQRPQATLPGGVRWHWERREAWHWPSSAWLAAAVLAACALAGGAPFLAALPRRRTASGGKASAAHAVAGLALAGAGLALLLAGRAGLAPGAAWSLLLCWAALWYGLAWRAGQVVAAGVLLLAAGLLLQLELGLGASDTSWLRHFQKTAAASALGMGCAGAWRALRSTAHTRQRAPIAQARVEVLLLLLAGCAVAALLVQVGWGNETGVFDMQPVEFAKLALTVLAAHCIALGLGGQHGQRQAGALLRWLRLGAPALLFVVLLGVALVQVDDYSPLILLLVWGAAMLLAWSFAARRAGPALALAALGACGLAGLALLRGAGVEATSEWSFYGERFGVWLDPAAHPHTGQQLLLGGAAIAGGGWLGADGLLGLASLGQGALEALAIPAVQDDFAPSFLLQRHGLATGLALWTLQALFLWTLLRAALGAWQDGQRARDFRHAWSGRFRCFVLCGGAAFLLGHFLLSWGTNLAFFPIMGQPMSFLSAGGSHLLFFIFPLLAFAGAGANTIEEN